MFLTFNYFQELTSLSDELLREGHTDEAYAVLTRAILNFPGETEGFLRLAKVCRRLGQPENALAHLHHALEIDPDFLVVYLELGDMHLSRGDRAQALMATRRAIEVFNAIPPDFPHPCQPFRELALMLNTLGEHEHAISILNHCVLCEPNDFEHHIALGRVLHDSGRSDLAEPEGLKALSLNPASLKALRLMVDVAQALSCPEKVLGLMQTVGKSLPYNDGWELMLMFAEVFELTGQRDAALTVLLSARQSYMDNQAIEQRLMAMGWQPPKIEIKGLTVSYSCGEKSVVLVSAHLNSRTLRLASGLRKAGWQVGLITGQKIEPQYVAEFDHVEVSDIPSTAVAIGRALGARIFHVMSGNACPISIEYVREKPGTVVFDPYDMVEGLIKQDYTYSVGQQQRFCMEHADALCCRDLRIRYLERRLSYRLPSKKIYFSDYCATTHHTSKALAARDLSEIHLVCCGTVSTNRSGHEKDWGYLDIAKKLAPQRIHLHLYPHPRQAEPGRLEREFADYIQFGKEVGYLHLHQPVGINQLLEELTQYHCGINAAHALTVEPPDTSYTLNHFWYCSSSRNIDYLEAGLPLMVNGDLHRYQYWMFKRYGVAIDATRSFFDNARPIMERYLSDPALFGRIEKARQAYSVEHNIGRLERFYLSL